MHTNKLIPSHGQATWYGIHNSWLRVTVSESQSQLKCGWASHQQLDIEWASQPWLNYKWASCWEIYYHIVEYFANFVVCCCSQKFSLWNLGPWHFLAWQSLRRFFPWKLLFFFHQFTKVLSLESFPLYSMNEPHSGNLIPYQMTQISPQVLDTSKQFIGGECPSPFCSRLQVGS